MKIHTFGDSHSKFGFESINNININHIGPVLCHSFGLDKLKKLNIENYGVKNNDSVIFCFGEIDCRCHIHKYINDENSYMDIIDDIIDNYIDAILENIFQYTNINVYIYNIVPPIQKYNTQENPEYPYLGTDEERKKYVLYFNERLKSKCNNFKFTFFDIYDKYIDINGFLNKDLSDSNVHIKDSKYIKEKNNSSVQLFSAFK